MNKKPFAAWTRRTFLEGGAQGVGALALASLLGRDGPADDEVKVPRWAGSLGEPHHPPRVKRVIFLTMAGGMSHLETLDHKPKLAEMNGKPMPDSFTKGQPIAQLQGKALTCLGPQHPF
ncbi:MAG: DUF1501 domain-containing protein, partial [Pirellulaceae bacterium]|nr:DUF1501 domain-containing protein [Pirellulaceae bacterium]